MLSNYMLAAMQHANYERLPEDGLFYGAIDGFDGVYATGVSLDECRKELAEVLEEWILLGISLHHPLPVVEKRGGEGAKGRRGEGMLRAVVDSAVGRVT